MRKVTFGGANSLDNYFARKDDSVDWLMWGKEAAEVMTDFWKTIDTIVMGRRTFEVGLKLSQGKSNPYPEMQSFVFSRTLKPEAYPDVNIITEDAGMFVGNLKKQKGKGICVMGGGLLAKSLFEAKVIDEIGFNIHPVLLGSGIPLFHEMRQQINLKLLECRSFQNGCVYVSYRVKH